MARYTNEMRERAVRMVAEVRSEHPHETAALRHVSGLLVEDRARRSAAARAMWGNRARQLGFTAVEAYLAARREEGASAWQVRRELGCGGASAARLLRG